MKYSIELVGQSIIMSGMTLSETVAILELYEVEGQELLIISTGDSSD
jgi:hypothetical protein